MKTGLYRRMGAGNIRKNYRFFIPRILAETGLLACFYIVLTLTMDKRMSSVYGGAYIPTFMLIGTVVIAILSVVLMAYTNSFLMKQRRKEFGLYNILGMEKKHVGRVLFHESLICSLIALILGLGMGLLFYKLCSLLICRLLQSEIIVGFYFITLESILPTLMFFVIIDLVIYLVNRIGIARMSVVELLHSDATGEREPRVKWVMLIFGILTLGSGYVMAITVQNPLTVLLLFFVAIILVMIGTYFLFVTGSIFVLKLLKNNKKYYYSSKHFSTVSGLIYRMKQNAVGLASIAILATGVLVMISTTVSLYSGMQETLDNNYPQQVYLDAHTEDKSTGKMKNVPTEDLIPMIEQASEKFDLEIAGIEEQEYLEVSFVCQDNILYTTRALEDENFKWSYSDLANFLFIDETMYEELTARSLELGENDIAICRMTTDEPSKDIPEGDITIGNEVYHITEILPIYPIKASGLINAINNYGIVVKDRTRLEQIYYYQKEGYGSYASDYSCRIAVEYKDLDKYFEAGDALQEEIFDYLNEYMEQDNNGEHAWGAYLDTLWDTRNATLGMYGTLLFLGIILGLVCMFATVLIIYYKQISEGYEDRNRFQIMKKVGMSDAEVRKTITSQVLLVFFLPLVVAGVHMCFAFPLLTKLLHLLLLSSTSLFILCSVITFAVFAVIYVIIYLLTAKTYYKIVR